MDEKQVWHGRFFKLADICKFLKSLPEVDSQRPKAHELFITWVVGRFLQSQTSSEHYVGFPSLSECEGKQLKDFVFGRDAIDNENFDTVIIDSRKREIPIRVQVKRYMNRANATTDDLLKYIREKTAVYGNASEINLVFHVHQNMKFDVNRFIQLAKGHSFGVGAVWVFFEMASSPLKCALFQVHPNLSRMLWSPSA